MTTGMIASPACHVGIAPVDHGGNDVSTHFRRVEDNRLDIVSGPRLSSIAAVES